MSSILHSNETSENAKCFTHCLCVWVVLEHMVLFEVQHYQS